MIKWSESRESGLRVKRENRTSENESNRISDKLESNLRKMEIKVR